MDKAPFLGSEGGDTRFTTKNSLRWEETPLNDPSAVEEPRTISQSFSDG